MQIVIEMVRYSNHTIFNMIIAKYLAFVGPEVLQTGKSQKSIPSAKKVEKRGVMPASWSNQSKPTFSIWLPVAILDFGS